MPGKSYFILLLVVLISLVNCISKKKLVYTKYYLIEPPLETMTAQREEKDIKLEISSVTIGPAYATTRIVNRNRSNEIVYFNYHEWAVLPKVSIGEFAKSYFKATQYFHQVASKIFGEGPDYRLDIEVNRIEMLSDAAGTKAHLVINYQYTDVSSGEIILEHSFDQHIDMDEKDANLLASLISELLWTSMDQVFQKMLDHHKASS